MVDVLHVQLVVSVPGTDLEATYLGMSHPEGEVGYADESIVRPSEN